MRRRSAGSATRNEGWAGDLRQRTLRIVNELGMHMRAANVFANLASRFQSSVEVSKSGIDVNGKSVMGLMMLAAICGSEIVVRVDGRDELQALDELTDLVQSGFGEGVSEKETAE